MLGSPVQANPEESFIDMLNALQKALAGAGLISSGDGTGDDGPGDGDAGGSGPSAKEYWISDVDPIVQNQCKGCHQTGGTAANSGARLLFTDSAEDNHLAMQSFVSSAGGSADLVLSKITGGAGHGGGRLCSGSIQYQAFEQYFVLLDGGTAVGVDDGGDFGRVWSLNHLRPLYGGPRCCWQVELRVLLRLRGRRNLRRLCVVS